MGKKILLIDDSAMLRRIAASVLGAKPTRYEVLAAARATEGFARACGSDVALILVDQRLLDVQGDDLTRRLLADPRTARIPVVLLVGRIAPLPALDTLPANVVETLRKPFAPEQLVAVVSAIIEFTSAGADFAELRAQLHPAPRADPATLPFRAVVEESIPPRAARPTPIPSLPARAPEPPMHDVSPEESSAISPRAALRRAANERFTGTLRFHVSGMSPIEVLTEYGRTILVTTRDGLTYSQGASEVLPPKVSPATFEAAIHEQSRHGVPFFLTLGARGLLSKAAAEALLHRFGQRCFSRLWTAKPEAVSCEFEAMDTLPAYALRLEPRREPLDEWLLGTLRHLDSGHVSEIARHEGFVGTPFYCPGGDALLQALPLTAAERGFARLVNGRNDLPAISRALDVSPETAFLTLYRFRCLDAMDYRPAPAAFKMTPRTVLRRVLPLQR